MRRRSPRRRSGTGTTRGCPRCSAARSTRSASCRWRRGTRRRRGRSRSPGRRSRRRWRVSTHAAVKRATLWRSFSMEDAMTRTFGLRAEWADEHGCRLHVAGELDVGTAPELRRAIGQLMAGGARTVVVDLARTEFLDSSGLGALLWAEHRLEAVGGSLAAVHPTKGVAAVLALGGPDLFVSV